MLLASVFMILLAVLSLPSECYVVTHLDRGFKYVAVYYGWLSTSNLNDLAINLTVVPGTSRILLGGDDYGVVQGLRSRGVEVYAYIHDGSDVPVGLGSSFKAWVIDNATGTYGERLGDWVDYVNSAIDRYVGVTDGVFLDECDPSYFTSNLSPTNPLIQDFSSALSEIAAHAHEAGLKVFINGVRAYAHLGDYYMWESFASTWSGSPEDPTYVYVTDFLQGHEGDDNPYTWVNDYAKYLYLRDNDLLNRTIAHTYGPPGDAARARYAYYLARALGLAGWSYAPANNYALGGPIHPLLTYPLGIPVEGPDVDPSEGSVSRWFTAGHVTVYVAQSTYSTNLTYGTPKAYAVDGDLSEWSLSGEDGEAEPTDPGLDIVSWGANVTSGHLFVAIGLGGGFTGSAVHVYVDVDRDQGTGYPLSTGSYTIGADYMVEAYPSGSGALYSYGGSGWSWDYVAPAYVEFLGSSVEVAVPAGFLQGDVYIAFDTTDSSWAQADVEPDESPHTLNLVETPYPQIYLTSKYVLQGTRLEELSIKADFNGVAYVLRVYNESGTYSIIKAYLSYPGPQGAVRAVIGGEEVVLTRYPEPSDLVGGVRGYYVEPVDSVYRYLIRVGPHASPIDVLIYEDPPEPLPEGRHVAVAIAAVGLIAVSGASSKLRRLVSRLLRRLSR